MTRCLVTFALAAMTFAGAPHGLKAADTDALCPLGNATLRGNYMSRAGGTIVGVGPVTAVGRGAFDGKGNVFNPFTISVNGVISRGTEISTYTVNPDCRGSQTASNGNHYDFVAAPDGSRFDWIATDAGRVLSGTAIRFTLSLKDD